MEAEEAIAQSRRDHLSELRRSAGKDNDEMNELNKNVGESKPIRFRNYRPKHGASLENQETVQPNDEAERQVAELVQEARGKLDESVIQIVPKKANWDLRREVEPHLKVLRQSTQAAISAIVKNRIEQEEQYDTSASEASDD